MQPPEAPLPTTTAASYDMFAQASTTTYSATTGLALTVSTASSAVAKIYDSHGRILTYRDGEANTTTTSYDAAVPMATVADGRGNEKRAVPTDGVLVKRRPEQRPEELRRHLDGALQRMVGTTF